MLLQELLLNLISKHIGILENKNGNARNVKDKKVSWESVTRALVTVLLTLKLSIVYNINLRHSQMFFKYIVMIKCFEFYCRYHSMNKRPREIVHTKSQ